MLSSSSSRSQNVYINTSKQFKLVSDPYLLLSFEDPGSWSASTGTLYKSTDVFQGISSLGIKNFQTTTLTSKPLNTLRAIGDLVSFGVKLNQSQSGSIKLLVSIPSLSLFDKQIGTTELEKLHVGAFEKIVFDIPDDVKTALNNEYNDLVFKFEISSTKPIDEVLLDDISFEASVISTSDKVEIEIRSADDFVYLTVNDVQKKMWSDFGNSSTGKIDISSMFWRGANSVKIYATNSGGAAKFWVALWVNGEQVLLRDCVTESCGVYVDEGIYYQTSLVLNTPGRPVARLLELDGAEKSNIYIDDHFSGKQIPTSFFIPQVNMTLGIGEYTDAPLNYKSRYVEEKILAGASNVKFDASKAPALGVQNVNKVAVVSIRKTIVSDTPRQGILRDSELALFNKNMQMVSDIWVEPLSYGLTKWQVDVIPTIENVALEMPTLGSGFDGSEFLTKAKLDYIKSQYQIIVFHYPGYDINGVRLDNGGGAGAWAMNGYFYVSDLWSFADDRPNSVILHEILHIYEQYQVLRNFTPTGTIGLHGAECHGYPEANLQGETDWVGWYREFIRGTVKENENIKQGIEITKPVENPEIYVGVFETFRRGLGFLH
ncbi:hypothetical protein GCM10011613_27890 [Cellvibrio zantedeschiae]|uniref:Uncharacterized protein n=2 Tax=Cellvibrio zantedeschiae TaxID=1237077 RepID=A0ABQ3B6Y9_9GAMM|nr:hypothetical protein GCM10011613_27890 [Cellvibrio zantedeschiae]